MDSPNPTPKTADGSLIIGTLFVLCGVVAGAAYSRFIVAGVLWAIGIGAIVIGSRTRRS